MKSLMKIQYLAVGILSLLAFWGNSARCQEALPDRYESVVQNYEKMDRETPPPADATFFIGSSTFRLWKEIPEVFADYKAVNRGFGGSRNFDWIIAAPRLVTPWKPKRVVFWCGWNDIAGGKSPEETFENFKRVVAILRESQPELQLFVCLQPHPPVRESLWEKYDVYGGLLKGFVDSDPNAFAIDYLADMCDENGRVRSELYLEDRLHFNAEGYKILEENIRAVLEKESPLP